MTNVKVYLPEHGTFWLLLETPELNAEACGALTPLAHCDDEGNLVDVEVAMFAQSYAHLFRGVIMRYGEPIGSWQDLQVVLRGD